MPNQPAPKCPRPNTNAQLDAPNRLIPINSYANIKPVTKEPSFKKNHGIMSFKLTPKNLRGIIMVLITILILICLSRIMRKIMSQINNAL